MKLRHLVQWAIVGAGFSWGATATACDDGAFTFSFSNIETRMAFAVIADAAGLRPQVDPSVQGSGPLKFVCTPDT
jgi:hypothetical protein